MIHWITQAWRAYIRWCDKMGLTPENRRCCMPRLEDPPLARNKPNCQEKAAASYGETKSE
ncbi:hypothetical protein [Shewanella mangrovisoli]|uniref:Uncharacterized protein n=1 Tax=Shewanella mangrovisoli TaxID=2864211 RepID=A0ABV4VGS9_9GAMM